MLIAICGPAGSGKSTLAYSMRKEGEVVIDLDSLHQAFTGLPIHIQESSLHGFMMAVKNTVIKRAKESDTTAYIIFSNYKYTKKDFDEVIIMDTSKEVCLKRVRGRQQETALVANIEEWFNHV